MNKLGQLLAEQSSPAEVLVFLAVSVAIFLAVAFLIYVLIMMILRVGLPSKVPLRRILFPGGKILAENLGDYVLAISTSVLLSLTLMVKHDLVQTIADVSMQDHSEEVSRLFDFGLPPDMYEEVGAATLSEVVQPLLAAGKVEESGFLVRHIVQGLPESWLTPSILIGACLLIAAIYLLWLARRRYKALRKDPGSSPRYGTTFRSLLTLAICVGLLLASALPLAQSGEKFLARSALDAIAHEGQSGRDPSLISQQIADELRKQMKWASFLYCPNCGNPKQSIWELVATGSGDPFDPQPFLDELNKGKAECQTACDADIARLQSMLDPIQRRLDELIAGNVQRDEQLGNLAEKFAGLESRLTELENVHVEDNAELGRRISEWERQLANVLREIDQRENSAKDLIALQERVVWLEAQHRERQVEPPAVVRNEACEEYAAGAVEKNKYNLARDCNLTGDRWSSNREAHYEWCVVTPQQIRNEVIRAQDMALRECSQGQGRTRYLENTNLPFGDIGPAPGNSPGECEKACAENDKCLAWTWVKQGALPIIPRRGLVSFCALKGTRDLRRAEDKCCTSGFAEK